MATGWLWGAKPLNRKIKSFRVSHLQLHTAMLCLFLVLQHSRLCVAPRTSSATSSTNLGCQASQNQVHPGNPPITTHCHAVAVPVLQAQQVVFSTPDSLCYLQYLLGVPSLSTVKGKHLQPHTATLWLFLVRQHSRSCVALLISSAVVAGTLSDPEWILLEVGSDTLLSLAHGFIFSADV